MATNTYTLNDDEKALIRIGLDHYASDLESYSGDASDIRELRRRLFGTESVVLTYPEEG